MVNINPAKQSQALVGLPISVLEQTLVRLQKLKVICQAVQWFSQHINAADDQLTP